MGSIWRIVGLRSLNNAPRLSYHSNEDLVAPGLVVGPAALVDDT